MRFKSLLGALLKLSSHNAYPDQLNVISVSATENPFVYTAPADGFLSVHFGQLSQENGWYELRGYTGDPSVVISGKIDAGASNYIPAAKGQKVVVNNQGFPSVTCKFVKSVGGG